MRATRRSGRRGSRQSRSTAVRRRTRQRSIHQSSATMPRAAAPAQRGSCEKIGLHRQQELIVSALTIHTSRKLAVIQTMSYLSSRQQDQTTITRATARPTQRAAQQREPEEIQQGPRSAGRPSSQSSPLSLQTMSASAAQVQRRNQPRSAASRRRAAPPTRWKNDRRCDGGRHGETPVPGNERVAARHTEPRHRSALNLSFQGQIDVERDQYSPPAGDRINAGSYAGTVGAG